MSDELLVEQRGRVRLLTLNRPAKRNALNAELIAALASGFEQAGGDDSVAAIVLAANGPSFCAGGDFTAVAHRTVHEQKTYLETGFHRVARIVAGIDKPIIALVNGPAVGAGVDLASMVDLRLASPSASFHLRYTQLGLVAGDGAAWFLPRIIGASRTLELVWSSQATAAQQALEIGLVNAIHPVDELLTAGLTEATRLAEFPPFAVRVSKRLVRQCAELNLDVALELMSSQQALAHGTPERRAAAAQLDASAS